MYSSGKGDPDVFGSAKANIGETNEQDGKCCNVVGTVGMFMYFVDKFSACGKCDAAVT